MRIGINLLYLLPGEVGGTETYAAGLLRGLAALDPADEYFVFVNREAAEWPLPPASACHRVVCDVSGVHRVRRVAFEQFHLPRLADRHRLDLLHSLGYVAPILQRRPSVVTIPDLNFRAFGTQMGILKQVALPIMVAQAARAAQAIVTLSEFSKREITGGLGVPAGKVYVTPLAPKPLAAEQDLDGIEERSRSLSPYIIAFSSVSPNKNVLRLVEAFLSARKKHGLSHKLVIVGHQSNELRTLLSTSPDSVFGTGYLTEGSLQLALRRADLMVFPSTYEGFGLPILEAMAAGVPVLCSDRASMPETAGDAALYFDPLSIEAIASRIGELALDRSLREELKEKGIRHVQRFSWEKTAAATRSVYERVTASEDRGRQAPGPRSR